MEFELGEDLRILPCRPRPHMYHEQCILQWLEIHKASQIYKCNGFWYFCFPISSVSFSITDIYICPSFLQPSESLDSHSLSLTSQPPIPHQICPICSFELNEETVPGASHPHPHPTAAQRPTPRSAAHNPSPPPTGAGGAGPSAGNAVGLGLGSVHMTPGAAGTPRGGGAGPTRAVRAAAGGDSPAAGPGAGTGMFGAGNAPAPAARGLPR